jgi:tetratricopeptide (TPR) repeat protein
VSRALSTPQEACTSCDAALTIARDLGDRGLEGAVLITLGCAAAMLGEYERAAQIFDRALTIVRELGDCWSEAECCWHYGLMLVCQGNREGALALLDTSVSYLVTIGHARAGSHTRLLAQVKAGEALPPTIFYLPLGGEPA